MEQLERSQAEQRLYDDLLHYAFNLQVARDAGACYRKWDDWTRWFLRAVSTVAVFLAVQEQWPWAWRWALVTVAVVQALAEVCDFRGRAQRAADLAGKYRRIVLRLQEAFERSQDGRDDWRAAADEARAQMAETERDSAGFPDRWAYDAEKADAAMRTAFGVPDSKAGANGKQGAASG